MTDSTQQPVSPAPTPAPSGDDKNPLDVLEGILKDAKAKGQGGTKPSGPTEEEIAAQKEAEELAKAQSVMAQKQVEDQQQILEQMDQLQAIKGAPENLAREEQIAEQKQEDDATEQAQDGFNIVQVGHSKI